MRENAEQNNSEYGLFSSLRIQSEFGKMRTRITPNADTFHAVFGWSSYVHFVNAVTEGAQYAFGLWNPSQNVLNAMFCTIWYDLYNFKNVKNTHGGALLLVKWRSATFTKSNAPPWVFFPFFKLYKSYQIVQRIKLRITANVTLNVF